VCETHQSKRGAVPDLRVSTSIDDFLVAARERGSDPPTTGRFLVTFREGATDAGVKSLRARNGFRLTDVREFQNEVFTLGQTGDAEAIIFPAIGVALVGAEAAAARKMRVKTVTSPRSAVQSIDAEYFMFADPINTTKIEVNSSDYLKGFVRMTQVIHKDLGMEPGELQEDVNPGVLGVTWGLTACKVPSSAFGGDRIKIAILGGGFDLGHPEFTGRNIVTNTFVGQPVTGFGCNETHVAGTACGPEAQAGPISRYGIGFQTDIWIGKVLTNTGSGTQAQVLAGMNWAISNKCQVILVPLGAAIPVQPSYTAAGAAALAKGCLLLAAPGNSSHRPAIIAPAHAPANSPTIVSVGALDATLHVAEFSAGGKVDIAAPGVNIFSSCSRPILHATQSGTSMAAAHAAGCAALWAQTSSALRGAALRAKLYDAAKHLLLHASDVGAGLVQAP
jgi:subtilisin